MTTTVGWCCFEVVRVGGAVVRGGGGEDLHACIMAMRESGCVMMASRGLAIRGDLSKQKPAHGAGDLLVGEGLPYLSSQGVGL